MFKYFVGIVELFSEANNTESYSIGAAIALSCAILGAVSNILTAEVN